MSQTTFFRFNRITLLAGIVGCALLPFVELTTADDTLFSTPLQTIKEVLVDEENNRTIVGLDNIDFVTADENLQAPNVLPLILGFTYMAGGLLVFVWLLISFLRMYQLIRSGEKHTYGNYKLVVVSQQISSFCWGRYIVMSSSDFAQQRDEILLHETMHLRYWHTFDLLFMQFFLVFFWFNPAIWLLKRELQEVHEFEADNGVLNTGINATRYQLLLVKKAVGTRLYSMANGFNHSKIKKRITMMLKERTNHWARLKLLFAVPVMAVTLYAFAQPEVKELTLGVEETNQQVKEDSYWTLIDFFKKEANAYEAAIKGKKHSGRISWLFVNKQNQILFNNQFVDLAGLQSVLEEHLYKSWKKNAGRVERIYFQYDRGSNEAEMGKILQTVKAAYMNTREKIALETSNSSKEYLDAALPILVYEQLPRNYANQKTEDVITEVTVTINDPSTNTRKELSNFTLDELKKELTAIQTASEDSGRIVVGVKANKDCPMGVMTDIKNVLRECSALRINYSTAS